MDNTPLSTDGSDREAADLALLYFNARLIGATTSGIQLVALGHGREAIIFERAQYEYFLKAIYFSHFEADARQFHLSHKAAAAAFLKRGKYAVETPANNDTEGDCSHEPTASDSFDNFVQLRDKLLRDTRFTRQAARNPLIEAFLRRSLEGLRNQWLWASQIVHASILDFDHVIVERAGHTFINVDGRHAYPNLAIANFAQTAFIAGLWTGLRLKKSGPDAEATNLGVRLQELAGKYKTTETPSVNSLFM